MTKKKPAAETYEITIQEREAMVDTVGRIFIGMYADLQKLKADQVKPEFDTA